MKLQFTSGFETRYKKLAKKDKKIKNLVKKQLQKLITDPRHPSLRLHKIEKADCWSISINKSIRVLLFFSESTATVFDIGKHEDVY